MSYCRATLNIAETTEDRGVDHETNDEETSCTRFTLDFAQADDGRPLEGGTFVADDRFPRYGVKSTAKSKSEQPQDLHPMILDSQTVGRPAAGNTDSEISHMGSPNEQCNGPGVGNVRGIGKTGENFKEIGNLLMLARRQPGGATTSTFSDTGVLVFGFYETITIHSISLLNLVDDGINPNAIELTIAESSGNGDLMTIPLTSVGVNGFQTIAVGAQNSTSLRYP
jgi:hypothetical protein